jgi:hypothetical protein
MEVTRKCAGVTENLQLWDENNREFRDFATMSFEATTKQIAKIEEMVRLLAEQATQTVDVKGIETTVETAEQIKIDAESLQAQLAKLKESAKYSEADEAAKRLEAKVLQLKEGKPIDIESLVTRITNEIRTLREELGFTKDDVLRLRRLVE